MEGSASTPSARQPGGRPASSNSWNRSRRSLRALDEAVKISARIPIPSRDRGASRTAPIRWELSFRYREKEKHSFASISRPPRSAGELVPVQRVGKLADRNPDNFFAETGRWRSIPATSCRSSNSRGSPLRDSSFVHGHAAHPPGRSELPRDPDQPPGGRCPQQPA